MIGRCDEEDCPHDPESNDTVAGAIPDIPIVLPDRILFVEVDEHAHTYYNPDCEIKRYDRVHYGTKSDAHAEVLPKRSLRLNVHGTKGLENNEDTKLLERLKVTASLNH